ncbi:hypothetical protein G6F46_013823 [Rhizopus delemar]|nr:hypothetical protein G6F46_013823 [Rhizopus delemar]
MALVMVDLVKDHGLQYLFAASILAGLLQVLAGVFKLGSLMRFVSRSVITGFVNALAILIFLAQMPELIGRGPTVYVLCAAARARIYLLPRITRAVPSPLGAIVVLTAVVIGFGPAALPASGCSAYLGNVAHPAAGISHAGGGRPARIDDDPADRRRHHRNAQRAQPRMRRPGRGQHGHRLPRRHGRLRDDRPVGHQRDLRRPRAPVLPGGRRGVAGGGGVRQ